MGLLDSIKDVASNIDGEEIKKGFDDLKKNVNDFKQKIDDDIRRREEEAANAQPQEMRPSPAREFLGEELYAIDCRGSNLYVHENAVVVDRTGGGLWNIGDNNFKVIPFKSIIAVQAKLESTVLSGYIEFETANSPLSEGRFNGGERSSENSVILSGAPERYEQAREALQYVFDHICK